MRRARCASHRGPSTRAPNPPCADHHGQNRVRRSNPLRMQYIQSGVEPDSGQSGRCFIGRTQPGAPARALELLVTRPLTGGWGLVPPAGAQRAPLMLAVAPTGFVPRLHCAFLCTFSEWNSIRPNLRKIGRFVEFLSYPFDPPAFSYSDLILVTAFYRARADVIPCPAFVPPLRLKGASGGSGSFLKFDCITTH